MNIKSAPGFTTVILSAERGDYTPAENASRYQTLVGIAAAAVAGGHVMGFSQLMGCYKGEIEPSIAVTLRHAKAMNFGAETGALFEQESILIVDSAGNGKLLFLATGAVEPIGSLTLVDTTDGLDAYSICRATGQAFTFT